MAIVSSPSAPVRTFGRFSMAPRPRIADVPSGMIGVPSEGAEHAGIRDRERRALHFLRLQPLVARAIGEIVERAREAGEREIVGILDDGNDQSPVERNGDADVVLLAVDDVGAGHGGVEHRELLERVDDRLDDERQVGELLPRLRLERRALLLADARDAREVDLEERGDVRVGVARRDHVVAGERADLRHRLDACRRARLRARGHAARRRGRVHGRARAPAAPVPPEAMYCSMSRLVTRPWMPVPCIAAISMPCSAAILRTSGEDLVRSRSSKPLPPDGAAMVAAAEDARELRSVA